MAWLRRCLPGFWTLALPLAVLAGEVTAAATVPAASHLQAAQRQSRADPALRAAFSRACASSAAPADAAAATQALQHIEAEHRRERAQPLPDAARLLHAVVLRGCMAYHATRLQAGVSYPVWLHTRLTIEAIRPAATGFEVQARVDAAGESAAVGRVTFSRGLHHACFVQTQPTGQASCTLLDTHPHGDALNGWAEAHEGPVVATYAGRVSDTVVALPAVQARDLPVFISRPAWLWPAAR